MFKPAILAFLFALGVDAQPNTQHNLPIPVVRGELQFDFSAGTTGVVVRLRSTLSQIGSSETRLHNDGSFEFPHVTPGSYTLTVATDSGETLAQENVEISSGTTLRVRARELPVMHRQASAGTVPVSELRHPPSSKTLAVLAKAHHATEAGDHATAVRELAHAAEKHPADGYLRTNLGIEYLRSGNVAAALPVLEEAARLIPDSPMTRGNLAYAYYLDQQWTRAETEARASLVANHGDNRMRYLLGASLMAQGSIDEALTNLLAAREAVPPARVLLAKYYIKVGRKEAAAAELRAYASTATPTERAKAEQWLTQLATIH